MKNKFPKTPQIFFLLLFGSFLFSGCEHLKSFLEEPPKADPAKTPFHQEMDAAMKKMQMDMEAVEMTMDPDVDFARMMIPHHQGAIDMSKIVLKYAKHERTRELARMFIESDSESQARLQAFLAAHGAPVPQDIPGFMEEMDRAMMKMNQTMRALNKSHDPDYDFAEMMIHHHQGAIDMSKIELEYGKQEATLEEARRIIEHQEKDIIELGKFKNQHGQPK
jgi:uncharacterized protein (DUF305 family)